MGYVKLTGSNNRHEDWTTEFILERDEETGEVTKAVVKGVPIDLTKEEQQKLENLGAVFEKSSADEAKEIEASRVEAPPVGVDVAAAAPVFATPSDQPNQNVETPKGDSTKK